MDRVKVHRNKNYTVMSNHHLRDKNLSYQAKGLLSFMLSLPEDWDYSVNGLTKVSKESKRVIQRILKELEDTGYLVRVRKNNEKGHFVYEYNVYETPKELPKKEQKESPKRKEKYLGESLDREMGLYV